MFELEERYPTVAEALEESLTGNWTTAKELFSSVNLTGREVSELLEILYSDKDMLEDFCLLLYYTKVYNECN